MMDDDKNEWMVYTEYSTYFTQKLFFDVFFTKIRIGPNDRIKSHNEIHQKYV
jgi:hypothetical protein